jgi:hypothetical protein
MKKLTINNVEGFAFWAKSPCFNLSVEINWENVKNIMASSYVKEAIVIIDGKTRIIRL